MRMKHITQSLVSPANSLPGTPAIAVHQSQAFDKEWFLRIIGFDPRLRCNFSPVFSLLGREF
jgi:hypothetical protein